MRETTVGGGAGESATIPTPRTEVERLLFRGERQGSLTCDEIAAHLTTSSGTLDRFLRILDDRSIPVVFPEAPPAGSGPAVAHAEQVHRARRIAVARSRLRVMLLSSPVGAELALETFADREDATSRRIRSLLEDARTCYRRLIRGGNGLWNEMVLRHTVRERAGQWSRLLDGTPLSPDRMRTALDRLEAYFARLADLRTTEAGRVRERRHGVLLETLEGYAALQARVVELRKRYEDYSRMRAEMASGNHRLVAKIAHRYRGCGLSVDDLIQEGTLGLMEAVERFDPARNVRFSTYAKWWIHRSIDEALASQAHAMRLPARVAHRLRRLKGAARRLAQEFERKPEVDESLDAAGMAPAEAERMSRLVRRPISLDQAIRLESDASIGDLLADDRNGSGRAREDAGALERALRSLPEREQAILRWRYGVGVPQVRDRKYLGEMFRLTPERIRQLETAAVEALRRRMTE